jgi:hypothetical protein
LTQDILIQQISKANPVRVTTVIDDVPAHSYFRSGNLATCPGKTFILPPVVATSYIRAEKRHVESVMLVAKQAQRADFLNG